MTRKNTEKTEAETRKKEQAEELATETKQIFQSRMRERRYKYTVWRRAPSTSSGTGVPLLRSVSLSNWPLSSGQDQNSSVSPLGAKSKGSNGVVAVGLPHRNYSVIKQAHIN